ncbi:Tyrosine-protein kinase [Parasponia andersonii]|uniref:Tyrosine-protein kinase n=1 Tax=Parasponia andersonii TaxID=3476 RepID=A0A2P5DXY5_PARAD|nr:Tyrosine-protein kinase [Parasponia andersonii]
MEPSYHDKRKNTEQSTRAAVSMDRGKNMEEERAEEQSSYQERGPYEGSPTEGYKEDPTDDDLMGGFETDEELVSICSKCENRRPKMGWTKEFTYAELQAATRSFSQMNFLSEGGFGSVYKGQLKNGLKIAVKQHKYASNQGEREFKAEVHFLSKARHENLVMLLGSCSEGSHRLLVYEYVCNGSLDQQLSKYARKPLTWDERMKIATGAAKGLQYLHANNIVHRDIRPNNILLTHDYDTLLGDFGLARTQHEDHSSETRVVGTLGYLAPEYAETGKVSTKTDVYAFGVILLQLITGRGTNDKSLEGKSLVGWARPLLKDRNYPDLIDKRIENYHDVHQLFWMVRVAEKCLSKDPLKRLTMEKVVEALNYLRESDAICNITLSPANSDSLPNSNRGSPETNADDDDDDDDLNDDDDHSSYVIEPKSRYSTGDDDLSGRLSQSYSTQSTSSGRSSLSP